MKRTDSDSALQSALAELDRPVAPGRDLWPDISLAISGTAQSKPGRPRWPLALAAALACTLFGGLWWSQRSSLPPATSPPQTAGAAQTTASKNLPRLDPRLVAADIELDAARAQLELALQRAPDAQFLKDLLAATTARQQRITHNQYPAG